MLHATRRAACISRKWSARGVASTRAASSQHDPLNILFCGADEFSIYSLRALRELQRTKPDKVQSIEVLCRPDKRVGRGLKQVREVPIKRIATALHLPLYQLDTFKSWTLPSHVNLIIAVSFGLLVPSRILSAAKYGGLNVHPSLLPDFRGPAPIAHTLLQRRSHTGVSVQTMHPSQFDRGAVLAQTASPGIEVPVDCQPEDLVRVLGAAGAGMLCEVIEKGAFVDAPSAGDARESEKSGIMHARKITPDDRKVEWATWTADEILLRDRVLGRLWDTEVHSTCFPTASPKRLTYQGPWRMIGDVDSARGHAPGTAELVEEGSDAGLAAIGVLTADGKLIAPTSATIEGEGKGKGLPTLLNGLTKQTQS